MNQLKSWRALLVREFIEHRMSFFWGPIGILALLTLAGVSALSLNRLQVVADEFVPYSLKIFEFGYLLLAALWLAYLAIAMFFYFGDAFNADRRNNAMLFWKSMPVSDLKVIASKFMAGTVLFPLIVLIAAMASSALIYLMINVAAFSVPSIQPIEPLAGFASFIEVSRFVIVYFALGILWYAPFFAWVGALSAVFGRWSLPLAFIIPGLLAAVENAALWGQGPEGGYVWAYLSQRWNFGLAEEQWAALLANPGLFRAGQTISQLVSRIDWLQMGIGLVFAALILWLASEYRRRRIT
jgi:ABC-2 type transport system permease protein